MPIIRIKKDKENPYVMINKKVLEDKTISLKAKGLVGYLLCKPDDWKFYIKNLTDSLKESRDTISKIIKELIDSGYCERVRQKCDKGRFSGYDYTIYETPCIKDRVGETVPVKPETGNKALLNIKLTNNKITNIYTSDFLLLWDRYPFKKGSKKAAYKAYIARVKDGAKGEDVARALDNYIYDKKKTEKEYILNAQTFFGPNERYLEYLHIEQTAAEPVEEFDVAAHNAQVIASMGG